MCRHELQSGSSGASRRPSKARSPQWPVAHPFAHFAKGWVPECKYDEILTYDCCSKMSNQKPPIGTDALPPERIPTSRGIASRAPSYEGLSLPAAVLLDNVRSMYNVGAFFRAADGVGLQKLCLAGITAHPPKKAISKTALGAEATVAWEHDWDAVRMAEGLRRSGFELAAIETSLHGVDLFEWRPRFPVCVAFGNEVDGLRPELLEMADAHVRIPMLGQKESLNVATAGGIVLYELLRKYRAGRNSAFLIP
jgi:23S rRNA (guanosine2251-2'-O)-methyltransferase